MAPLRAEIVEADTTFTALLSSSGNPLIGVTSLFNLDVIFWVARLYPVNCTVAPSTESSNEPHKPAIRPAGQA